MTTANHEEQRDQSDSKSPVHTQLTHKGLWRVIVDFRWLILYLITFTTIIWWYEFRPATLAILRMQGTWQAVEGAMAEERLVDRYRYVSGRNTWSLFKYLGRWHAPREIITLRPANNVFVVRREYNLYSKNTFESEYMVCIKDNQLYLLSGLATFDTSKQNTIQKFRRVDSLPPDAKNTIQE